MAIRDLCSRLLFGFRLLKADLRSCTRGSKREERYDPIEERESLTFARVVSVALNPLVLSEVRFHAEALYGRGRGELKLVELAGSVTFNGRGGGES